MIGRSGAVRPFDLIKWARAQAHPQRTHRSRDGSTVRALTGPEAHLLLILATYADENCIAWPSIKTLAETMGRKPTKDGRNSAVSAALGGLEELGLIWTTQGGRARSARRELLFNPALPSGNPEGKGSTIGDVSTIEPSGNPEGIDALPSGFQDVLPSGFQDQKYQEKGHSLTAFEKPKEKGQECLPEIRKASHPDIRTGNDDLRHPRPIGDAIRALIDNSGIEEKVA